MERLTYRPKEPYISRSSGDLIEAYSDADIRDIINRLAAYEDTGLTPEEVNKVRADTEAGYMRSIARAYGIDVDRLRELIRADREGRVEMLPCKVGDTVYWVHSKAITRCRVYRIQKNLKGIFICLRGDGKSYGAFQADLTIGKTIFLTREEALRMAENG